MAEESTPAGGSTMPRPAPKFWVRVTFYLLMGVAVALLIWGTYKGWDELSTYSLQVNWLAIGASALAYGATILVTVWGWHSILRGFGAQISYLKNVKFYCSTNLARRLPTVLFYTAGRAYVYAQEEISATVVSVAVLLELLLVAGSGVIVSTLSWLLVGELPSPVILLAAAAVSLAIVLVLVVRPRFLTRWLNKLAIRLFKVSLPAVPRHALLRWMLIYGLNWVLGGTMLFFLVRALTPLSWSSWVDVISIWSLSGLVSTVVTMFIPAGLGPREVTMAYLLGALVPVPIAVAIAALSRVWIAVNQLLWFLISLMMRP